VSIGPTLAQEIGQEPFKEISLKVRASIPSNSTAEQWSIITIRILNECYGATILGTTTPY